MTLAVLFSVFHIQSIQPTKHPLELAPNRPQKAWQTVLNDGAHRTYEFYGLECGVLCVAKEEAVLLNPFGGKVKWRLSFPDGPDSTNKTVKFSIQNSNRIAIDIGRQFKNVQDEITVIEATTGRKISSFEFKNEYAAFGMAFAGDRVFLEHSKGVSSFTMDGTLLSAKSEIPRDAVHSPFFLYENDLQWGKFLVKSVEIEDFPMDNGQASGLTGTKLIGPDGKDIWNGRFMRFNRHGGLTNLDGTKATDIYYPSVGLDSKGLWVVRNRSTLVRILPNGTIDPHSPQPKTDYGPTWTNEGIIFTYRGTLKSLNNGHVRALGKIPEFADALPTITRWGMIREDIHRTGQDRAKTTLRLDPIRH